MHYIEIQGLTKEIKGVPILKDIHLSLEQGKIYGLIGKNGSGKTMLLRAICGLIQPTAGTVTVNGKQIGKDVTFAPSTGLLIENVGLWGHLTAFENLKLLSSIATVKRTDAEIKATIQTFGLDPESQKPFKKFSLGMKQRLSIAQAFLDDPQLFLLDEPTNALDPEGTEEFFRLLRKEKEKGKTIVISSHDHASVEALCDVVYTMYDGVLSGEGTK